MQLEIGVRASRDLDEMHAYGMNRYGPAHADSYLGGMFAKFDHIAQWPYAARRRAAARSIVRILRHVAHNIVYEVEGDTVTILRVFHHSVNWIDLL